MNLKEAKAASVGAIVHDVCVFVCAESKVSYFLIHWKIKLLVYFTAHLYAFFMNKFKPVPFRSVPDVK